MSATAEQYDVIRKPIITEKTTMASESGAVVFEVAIDSTKPQIKEAVEALFGVKVKAVNTTITKGKTKRFGGRLGAGSRLVRGIGDGHADASRLRKISMFSCLRTKK